MSWCSSHAVRESGNGARASVAIQHSALSLVPPPTFDLQPPISSGLVPASSKSLFKSPTTLHLLRPPSGRSLLQTRRLHTPLA